MDFHVLALIAGVILLDIVFGFAGAVKLRDVRSSKLRNGLWHKAGFVGLIVLAYVVEYAASYADLGFEVPSVLAVCVYVFVTELVSVFENLCVLNPGLVRSPLGVVLSLAPKDGASDGGAEAASGDDVR